MTDLTTTFWNRFDACLNEIRAERMASEKVTTLRPDMKPEDRAHIALFALEQAIAQLEMVADAAVVSRAFIDRLSDADTRLSLLRPRMNMRRSLVHLTGTMGRPGT